MLSCPKNKPIRLKGKAYKKLQVEVLERDRFMCMCGKYTESPPHHIIPRGRGGSDTADNLITLCDSCHRKAHGQKN